jgi:hypothetical protein
LTQSLTFKQLEASITDLGTGRNASSWHYPIIFFLRLQPGLCEVLRPGVSFSGERRQGSDTGTECGLSRETQGNVTEQEACAVEDSTNAKTDAELYLSFLKGMGYYSWITPTGNVAFQWEGRTYVIMFDEKDEAFVQLGYPRFWRSDSNQELAQMKEAALAVTAETRVVKIYLVEGIYACAAVEMFCNPLWILFFDRCLKTLHAGVQKFEAKIKDAQLKAALRKEERLKAALRKQPPEKPDDFVFYFPRYTVGGN